MSDLNEQLLPCPFCGSAVRIDSNRDWHKLAGHHRENCPFDEDYAFMVPATAGGRDWLAAAWNRRAPAAAPAPVAAIKTWQEREKLRPDFDPEGVPERGRPVAYMNYLISYRDQCKDAEIADLRAALAAVPAAAPIVQPVGDVVADLRNVRQWMHDEVPIGTRATVAKLAKLDHVIAALAAPSVQAEPNAYRYGTALLEPEEAPIGEPDCQPLYFAAPTTSTADAKDAALREVREFLGDMHCMPVDWTIKQSTILLGRVDAAIATSADEVKS